MTKLYTNMAIQGSQIGLGCGCNRSAKHCVDTLGCPSDVCPNFIIKRHDTKPAFRVSVEDCDGALDLTDEDLILEVNMWAKGKLKAEISNTDTYFSLADNIGFEQAMVGDIIVMERVRTPEHMLVTGFDETNKLIQVQRSYNGTSASSWKKGTGLKIFRVMNSAADIETSFQDIIQTDGTVAEDQLVDSFLVYHWKAKDTCLPGCYWLEFKLLKMSSEEDVSMLLANTPSIIPSFTPSTLSAENFGCILGDGIEWARRFPSDSVGFLIRIEDTPTAELI